MAFAAHHILTRSASTNSLSGSSTKSDRSSSKSSAMEEAQKRVYGGGTSHSELLRRKRIINGGPAQSYDEEFSDATTEPTGGAPPIPEAKPPSITKDARALIAVGQTRSKLLQRKFLGAPDMPEMLYSPTRDVSLADDTQRMARALGLEDEDSQLFAENEALRTKVVALHDKAVESAGEPARAAIRPTSATRSDHLPPPRACLPVVCSQSGSLCWQSSRWR